MDLDTLRNILLAAAGVITGGGFLKLLDFWFKHRAEIRKITTSSVLDESTAILNQSSVYKGMVDQLQADGAVYREQLHDLQGRFERLEAKRLRDEQTFADQLRASHSEIIRMTTRVAQLTTDLDVAARQLEEMRRRRKPT